ncbi:uncharacterized protein LOC143449077 [Clavelina lepadiformis]|uniref:uncharacterized protein LOC143449077 n=1 Tax=Clavelina lepadiformis TaxID=159417 RepID=UPI00404338A1
MNPTDLPLMHQILEELKKVQARLDFPALAEATSISFVCFKAIQVYSTTPFSSQHSAVSHFVNCRFFPTSMTCGDMAESWNAE